MAIISITKPGLDTFLKLTHKQRFNTMIIDRKTIKWKLFIYYFLLLAVFTLSMILFQNHREQHFRTAQLESTLNEYTDLTNRFINNYSIVQDNAYSRLDSLKKIIPPEKIRLTVINFDGKVLYDNTVSDYLHMENHKERPEVQKALYGNSGENIRFSATTKEEYFYYAKSYNNFIIRAAAPYNNEIRNFLKTDKAYIIFFLGLFIIFGILLNYIVGHIGDTISKLKDFVIKIRRDEPINPETRFSSDELGFISHEIVQLYEQSRKTKGELILEKEKLISHLFVLKEGIAFFSADKKVILNNSHFIFYINIIAEETTISVEKIFHVEEFRELNNFIDKAISDNKALYTLELPRMECMVQKAGYHFLIQCIVFADKSFEILISDKTSMMKRSIMKQEITSNISHELKTPIASVKGYLETVLNNPNLEITKQHYFIEKAFNQSERLTQLVNDIALLNKIEEYSELYAREKVGVKKAVNEAIESFSDQISLKGIHVECFIGEDLIVNANYSLVFSIFRNLMENSVNYAGENTTISISKYHEDNMFYYFSFADNGTGVEEEHLPRIFERFYRVDSGRSRKEGGTGLGLAIVKNAILSFKGEISARNKKEGGLEFLFSLPK
jgi:two-component system phosphate regulon sensor histidine kinase PhoR